MLDVSEFQTRKDLVRKTDAAAERAAGSLEQVMKTLKEEHGCNTIQAANLRASIKKEEAETKKAAYTKARDEFDKEWAEFLAALPK